MLRALLPLRTCRRSLTSLSLRAGFSVSIQHRAGEEDNKSGGDGPATPPTAKNDQGGTPPAQDQQPPAPPPADSAVAKKKKELDAVFDTLFKALQQGPSTVTKTSLKFPTTPASAANPFISQSPFPTPAEQKLIDESFPLDAVQEWEEEKEEEEREEELEPDEELEVDLKPEKEREIPAHAQDELVASAEAVLRDFGLSESGRDPAFPDLPPLPAQEPELSPSSKLTLEDLKYIKLYPKTVRRWVEDAKKPKGYYDENGRWQLVDQGKEEGEAEVSVADSLRVRKSGSELNIPSNKLNTFYAKEDLTSTQRSQAAQELERMEKKGDLIPYLEKASGITPEGKDSDDFMPQLWEAFLSQHPEFRNPFQKSNPQRIPVDKTRVVLPRDLEGGYRFGIKPEDLEGMPEKLKTVLSLRYASQKEKDAYRKAKIIQEFGRTPIDTGSSEIQVAMLTVRIRSLTDHLKKHKQDKNSKVRLHKLLIRRRNLQNYIKKDRTYANNYYQILKTTDHYDTTQVNVKC